MVVCVYWTGNAASHRVCVGGGVLSDSALVSINNVTLCQARLLLGQDGILAQYFSQSPRPTQPLTLAQWK